MEKQKTVENNIKIVIPFLKAAIKVLNEITTIKFNKKEVYPLDGHKSIGDIKVEIRIVGDIETRIIFDFPRDLAFKLAKDVVGNALSEYDTKMLEASILEMSNMIAGNAMGFLEEINLNCNIMPPKVYIGKNINIFYKNTKLGVIELTSPIGDFNIYLVLKEDIILDPAGIVLYNITEIVTSFFIEVFIPKGFSIYSVNDITMLCELIKSKDISLVFIGVFNLISHKSLYEIMDKILNVSPNIKIVFYCSEKEWNKELYEKYKNNLLGYIPKHFDNIKTAKAMVLLLERIGVKYNVARKHVRVKLSDEDKAKLIIYSGLKDINTLTVKILDISVGGVLVEFPPQNISEVSVGSIFEGQFSLKGFVVKAKLRVQNINENMIGLSFLELTDDDVRKISFFIHEKLNEVVKS
ncbi:MAG TPA: chemotaxis protein CheX [Spirochaetota bacterium]|nr:chemotaxis protein CheX [Spirochaetota bacterium]HOM38094.1 chemotaxis protein CheX [Spirochaetota bacterium]HPQ48896.1 chemotaxis protein CheX [Spirochaetota bacterium]